MFREDLGRGPNLNGNADRHTNALMVIHGNSDRHTDALMVIHGNSERHTDALMVTDANADRHTQGCGGGSRSGGAGVIRSGAVTG